MASQNPHSDIQGLFNAVATKRPPEDKPIQPSSGGKISHEQKIKETFSNKRAVLDRAINQKSR